MSQKETKYNAPALDKGLDILEYLSSQSIPWNLRNVPPQLPGELGCNENTNQVPKNKLKTVMQNHSLTEQQVAELFSILKNRFNKNMHRHEGIEWSKVQAKLEANPNKLWSINEMELSGGEPDVIAYDKKSNEYTFCDCSPESPKGRRSVCYDPEALESRKEHKPKHSALGMAVEIGIEILDEQGYRALQNLGKFDTKTSSWIKTPDDIRERGGAIFGDWRYGHVFIYHNGAESYYAARGFRGWLKV